MYCRHKKGVSEFISIIVLFVVAAIAFMAAISIIVPRTQETVEVYNETISEYDLGFDVGSVYVSGFLPTAPEDFCNSSQGYSVQDTQWLSPDKICSTPDCCGPLVYDHVLFFGKQDGMKFVEICYDLEADKYSKLVNEEMRFYYSNDGVVWKDLISIKQRASSSYTEEGFYCGSDMQTIPARRWVTSWAADHPSSATPRRRGVRWN